MMGSYGGRSEAQDKTSSGRFLAYWNQSYANKSALPDAARKTLKATRKPRPQAAGS